MKPQEFKNMYGSTPDSFKMSISNALRKTGAEEPIRKRITIRTVLVTALVVILIAGVALAATSQWKLQDYFQQIFGTWIPQAGQEVLEQSGAETYTLGGAKFTRQESIADGHLVYFSTRVESLDENVILFPMSGDMGAPLPDSIIGLYGFEKDAMIHEAAQSKQLKIYCVAAYPEIVDGSEYNGEMLDERYQEDGSLVLINMLPLETDQQEMQIGYNYRFAEYDPLTGDRIEESRLSETDILTIPVQQPLAIRTFTAADDQISNDLAYVQSVTLTQMVTGVYVDIHLMLKGEIEADRILELYGSFELLDDEGNSFPAGIIFSGNVDHTGYPEIVIQEMLSMESLPDHLSIATREEDSMKIVETFAMTDYEDVK